MIFLNASVAADGQVQAVDTGTVTSFNGPQGYVGANPLVTTDAVDDADMSFGGFKYRYDGALRIAESSEGSSIGGLLATAAGQLCVVLDAVGADVANVGGVAVTNDGRVYMDIPA